MLSLAINIAAIFEHHGDLSLQLLGDHVLHETVAESSYRKWLCLRPAKF